MLEFFMDLDMVSRIEAVAGCIVSVWGVVKIVILILDCLRKRRTKPFDAISNRLGEILGDLEQIKDEAKDNAEAIATLQLNALNTAFVHYVDHGRPCPMFIKTSLSEMYKQYKSNGERNHVATDYIERLIELPVDERER